MWMSLRDAVARASSFADDLLPHLKEARIMARAEGFYTSEGKPWKGAPADGRIPADWWAQLCSVDPAANRATFRLVVFSMVGPGLYDKVESFTDDILAIGVELERAAAEARLPEATVPASAPRHAGGRPIEHKWERAAQYVDHWVAEHQPLPRDEKGEPVRARAVELMIEGFKENDPPPPKYEEDIYRWLRENWERCRKWWG